MNTVCSAHILVIDDNEDILKSARVILRRHFDKITLLNHPQYIEKYLKEGVDLVLLDMNFSQGVSSGEEGMEILSFLSKKYSSIPVVLMTAYAEINLAVRAMKEGAADFIVKPWNNEYLLQSVKNNLLLSEQRKVLAEKNQSKYNDYIAEPNLIIGEEKGLKDIFSIVNKVAKTDANILILGENGTGKEIIAKAIHNRSLRAKEKMLTVDLGALPGSLFESELFGYEKGAFTGAQKARVGRMEEASRGTLFLDEIGNIPLEMQVKLLSVLQSRQLTRLGSNKVISISPRLICATNSELQKSVAQGSFRQDLFYRVNTVSIYLPPLRERLQDIDDLVNYFIDKYVRKYDLGEKYIVDSSAFDALRNYSWPGNVRELEHVVERALILTEGNTIKSFDLPAQESNFNFGVNEDENDFSLNLEELEKKAIKEALRKHQGNLSQAARELGLGRTTLYRKITRYGI
ncbi:MAG: sigma-54-dependent transcriptional regulator [Bacteroidales bacterium]